jgi:hypothetical protein
MNAVSAAVNRLGRIVGRAATMTTEAAGAVGGAAVNGVIGGVTGAAAGMQRGLGSGSHSTPAAALTLGALGAAGLVEWPLLLTVGGTALVVKQLSQRPDTAETPAQPTPLRAAKTANTQQSPRTTRAKSSSPRRTRAGQ